MSNFQQVEYLTWSLIAIIMTPISIAMVLVHGYLSYKNVFRHRHRKQPVLLQREMTVLENMMTLLMCCNISFVLSFIVYSWSNADAGGVWCSFFQKKLSLSLYLGGKYVLHLIFLMRLHSLYSQSTYGYRLIVILSIAPYQIG